MPEIRQPREGGKEERGGKKLNEGNYLQNFVWFVGGSFFFFFLTFHLMADKQDPQSLFIHKYTFAYSSA